MELIRLKELPLSIQTDRFILRELSVDDVSDRYLSWLSESEAEKWIVTAKTAKHIADLKAYVLERSGREDVLFLGIFEKYNGLHIGNIKYEPIDSIAGYAIMGILIGDAAYRGKGVTTEVLLASAKWLKIHRQIHQLLLGVDKENKKAIRAYEKIGFYLADTPHIQKGDAKINTMRWQIAD